MKEVTINLKLLYPKPTRAIVAAMETMLDMAGNAPTMRDISDFMLHTAVDQNPEWANGMPETESKLWSEIMKMLADGSTQITISGDQFSWLHRTVERFNYRPALSRERWLLIEELDRAKKAATEQATTDAETKS